MNSLSIGIKVKLLIVSILLLKNTRLLSQTDYTKHVNPFIGTGGHGHTFPGAVWPFGMVQLSPDTRVDGSWDGCSGYHYSDSIIYGFSHTHLSGTGCSDWGDVLLMPVNAMDKGNSYSSTFSHNNESAKPGYYQVFLNRPGVNVELTTTQRVGIHRYHFPVTAQPAVTIDLKHRDKTLDYSLSIRDSVTVVGFRVSEAWAREQRIYFAIRFSKSIKSVKDVNRREFVKSNLSLKGYDSFTLLFGSAAGQPLLAKVAISPVSIEGAMANLEAEAKHWDFENYAGHAREAWNKQLSKIHVKSNSADKLSVFYSSLYHCFIHPTLATDVTGNYRGMDNKIYKADGYTHYTVFSLWDTYRALHPLFTILEQKRTNDFIKTFLSQYRQSGRLPVWELSSFETDCMIGFHSVSVIADAMLKGIKGYDTLAAYSAMKAASNYTGFGIPEFNRKGYLQIDDEHESVSKTLEYGYDNWCVARVAGHLKQTQEEALYLKRSLAYMNLFDAKTGNMRPRKNGGWLNPFYPTEINNHFTEGNSWQYSFYVPHDVEGLIKLHGGEKKFEAKLDELFENKEATRGREQADVTGLVGQYAHGNEPSHHMAYLYNFTGSPQKTVQRVRQLRDNFYSNKTDGLIGNEDCGQMSAWYVFSALGFYPVCPGSTQYVLGEPAFDSISVKLENGKSILIIARSGEARPVSGVRINKDLVNNSFIDHHDLMKGPEVEFRYYDETRVYGADPVNRPTSAVKGIGMVPAPIISARSQVFKDTLSVAIEKINMPIQLLTAYSADGKQPGVNSPVYNQVLKLDSTCKLKARLFANGAQSEITEARFYRIKNDYNLNITCSLNAQYMAEGAQTMLDGIKGDADWRKGNWLGIQGSDFTCTIDLKKQKEIRYLGLECLQDTRSWIVYPQSVSYFGSNDGKTFVIIGVVKNTVAANDYNGQVNVFEFKPIKPIKYQYLKVVAKNYGKLPAWHLGSGGEAFVFTDELEVR